MTRFRVRGPLIMCHLSLTMLFIFIKVNSIERRIQPLNQQIRFHVYSIQRQIQPLNPQKGFNVNSIQRLIQQLNPQIGLNIN